MDGGAQAAAGRARWARARSARPNATIGSARDSGARPHPAARCSGI